MTDRPRITTAVLMILKDGPATPAMITSRINSEDQFAPLRRSWDGKLTVDQVYAAMSSLRSKVDPKRNFIIPKNGVVGKAMTYEITGYGEKRLRGEPKTYGDVGPALAAHIVSTAAAAPALDEQLAEGWCFLLMYRPPCGRWYAHSHKLYNCPSDARDAARRFLHPDTPIAIVPVPANPPVERIR